MTKFNYVSLFSGIGGFEQALNAMGGNCVLSSEIDKFANQSYEALYGHPTAGDITSIAAEDVPDHDVLVGGFPCQSFSVAGKRGGMAYICDSCDVEITLTFEQYIREEFGCTCGGTLEPLDPRGVLFNEIARIALRNQPRVILLENVKGLVGHDKGRTLDTIVKTLNDIGYTVDFTVLNSKHFGVAQNRERIFIIALRDDLITPEPWVIEGNTVVPKGKRRISAYEGVKTFNFDWPVHGEVTTRLRDVLETQVDEKYYLSEDKTAALVAQLEDGLAIREATKQGYTVAAVGDAVGDAVNFQFPESKTRRGRVGKEIANTLEASSISQGVVEESPVMLGHIDLKGHDAIKRVYSAEGVSPTVTTMGGGHREPKTAVSEGTRYRIRKLTPLECFRLQGFSDEAHQTLVDAGISDSQRYKQAGNAVTVNVIQAIGDRLLPLITP